MEFTGERFVPSEKGIIRYEHLHRYLSCLNFVSGKSVVDIACGEGYGSTILSTSAESVIGVDVDIECICHAKNTYQKENISFLVGSCEAIPVESQSIDVVISFETIEHHNKHDEMISEIKRILKPNGSLIISSPNRSMHFDTQPNLNPFHIKELYYEEFKELLNKYFKNTLFYGHQIVTNSLIMPLQKSLGQLEKITAYPRSKQLKENLDFKMYNPSFYIAICSDEELSYKSDFTSIYIDSQEDLFKEVKELQKTLNILQLEKAEILGELESIKNSNFGKLRELWLSLKAFLGIPKNYNFFIKVKAS